MPPPNDAFSDVLRELRETRGSLDRLAKVNDRLAQGIGDWNDETDMREREMIDTFRRASAEAADREKRWIEELAKVGAAITLTDRGMQDVKGEVKELNDKSGEFRTVDIRDAADEYRRRPVDSDPPPGKVGAVALAGGYLLRQWGKQSIGSKILLVLLFGMMWAVGGHSVLRWLEGRASHALEDRAPAELRHP